MSASSEAFVGDLFAMVKERRSFHPLWKKIEEGEVPREKMKIFGAQFFLQVREFPRAISALHSRCYDSVQRLKLAESLYEEETGMLSGSAPHPEFFIRVGTGLGMKREELTEAKASPSTAALIDWFELSTKDRSFDEGIAAINGAAEGHVPGNFESFARALQKHYGLNTEQVSFFDLHELADRDHSDVGDQCFEPLRNERSGAGQNQSRSGALSRSLVAIF